MKRLAVLGASGHGKVVADIAESSGWDEIVFFDDRWPSIKQNSVWPVEGASNDLLDRIDLFSGVFVAIGNNDIRSEKLSWLAEAALPVVSLIHPTAVISRYAEIGAGCVVMPGVVVNAGSTVLDGVILNTACSIDHDCKINTCVHISPGARLAGGVRVGEYSWIGIGASVKQLVTIGAHVVVGAGAAVVSNLPDAIVATGVPARW